VVVVDCVVLCASTGSDRAIKMSDPRTTANSVLDFIDSPLLHRSEAMVWLSLPLNLVTIARRPGRINQRSALF
jgi:hypothetical protein